MLMFILIALFVVPVVAVAYAAIADAVSDAKFYRDFDIK